MWSNVTASTLLIIRHQPNNENKDVQNSVFRCLHMEARCGQQIQISKGNVSTVYLTWAVFS
uniref:Uncharacterized protein n=1 Tax=Octopus bimaculoides TaxID=37653 RepID=A0A0L8GJ52_OCTBM